MNPSKVRASDGNEYTVLRPLASGGQGEVFLARNCKTGQMVALKLLYEKFSGSDGRRRTKWLVAQDLSTLSSCLLGPCAYVENGSRVGHISRYVPSPKMDELLASIPWSFGEGIGLAAVVSQAVQLCEDREMGIGDLASTNVLMHRDGWLKPLVIDFDNFIHRSMPLPPMAGQRLYLAPEIAAGGTPSVESDRYSLMVIVHELILGSHPLAGHDQDEEAFTRGLMNGRWMQDPILPRHLRTCAGLPAEVLSPDLLRLFRRGAGIVAASRPTAKEWATELKEAQSQVYQCEHCAGELVADSGKANCPLCGKRFVPLRLESANASIPLAASATPVGRKELKASRHVSKRHVIVRRHGPLTFLEDISSTGVWRQHPGGGRVRLPGKTSIRIQAGDVLWLGDTRVDVVAS